MTPATLKAKVTGAAGVPERVTVCARLPPSVALSLLTLVTVGGESSTAVTVTLTVALLETNPLLSVAL